MKYVFISRKGDKEQFLSFYNYLKNLSGEELINQYNKQVELGIVGVHAQALKLLALRKLFIERFGKSPIKIEDEVVIRITGKIDINYVNS